MSIAPGSDDFGAVIGNGYDDVASFPPCRKIVQQPIGILRGFPLYKLLAGGLFVSGAAIIQIESKNIGVCAGLWTNVGF